jgi:Tol biopolymer transport system component
LNADFSPDGKFVTYQSNASGEEEVYVQPFPNLTGQKWIVSRGGGSRPAWSRDEQQIFFISPAGEMMSVAVQRSGSTLATATPVTLFHGPYYLGGGAVAGRTYDVAADGRFLMMKPVSGASSPNSGGNIEVIINWFEELKRAVPYQ